MIDLSQEKLIPLKTMGKRRDGKLVVFIEAISQHGKWRWCGEDTSGTFKVNRNGRESAYNQGGSDIISIARKWEPKEGETVSVLGYGKDHSGEAEDISGITFRVVTINELTHLVHIRLPDASTDHSGGFIVRKEQLRRYVAPAASEAPQRTEERADTIPF